ncbi:MAG: ABC transporter ATP-binding protein [Coriobacteriaceae bacterium]|nr:ABC transporter ATP-binding protein [Coriobacteriaceae bacterium]
MKQDGIAGARQPAVGALAAVPGSVGRGAGEGAAAPGASGPAAPAPAPSAHGDGEFHHHHTHAADTRHPGRHHLLTVQNLTVAFDMYDADAPFFRALRRRQEVVRDLTVSVHTGEILAVVGASGAGKTVLADCIMGRFASNEEVSGEIWFDGELMDASGLERLRGRGISLVPQSVTHLDPLMRVGAQVRGAARGETRSARAADARRRAERQRALFADYGLAPEVADLYPHQLSGGMARRILLMCALMDEPRLLLADEPTPGLDLDLAVRALGDLRRFADTGGGVLLITHDIELALRVADRVAIVRAGTVVEETARESFEDPSLLRDPYTRALWHAMPKHGFQVGAPTGDGDRPACGPQGAGEDAAGANR